MAIESIKVVSAAVAPHGVVFSCFILVVAFSVGTVVAVMG